MSFITEEDLRTREMVFFDVVNEIVSEHYSDVAPEPLTEENAYLLSILLDHFVDEYKNPTIYETYVASTLGQPMPDHNDALYEELVDLLLDESIGSKIASIAHGVQHFLAGKKKAGAERRTAGAQAKSAAAAEKARAYATKVASKPASAGVKGGFEKGRVQSLYAKSSAASEKHREAREKEQEAAAKHHAVGAKRSALAQKIDTGLSNIKKKATAAIQTGAHRVSSALHKGVHRAAHAAGKMSGSLY